MAEQGLKPKSIKLKLTVLKSFYRYCIQENKIKKNPTAMIKSPKLDDFLHYYLSKREVTFLQELTRKNLLDSKTTLAILFNRVAFFFFKILHRRGIYGGNGPQKKIWVQDPICLSI